MRIFSFSVALSLIFWGICIVFQVLASDWDVYGNTTVNYESFYFVREFVSWTIISILSKDASSSSNAIVSSFIFFLLIHSSFLIVIKSSKLLSNKRNTLLPLAITPFFFTNFYLLMSLNGLRQGIAIAFFCYAIYFLISEKKPSSFLFLLLSIFSHNATIFFVPAYLMMFGSFYKLNKLIPLAAFSVLFLGSTITSLAGKSSGTTNSSNSEVFLLASLVAYTFVVIVLKKTRKDKWTGFGGGKYWPGAIPYFLFYFPIAVIGLYSDENSFERTIYYSMVILICFACGALSKFKQSSWIALVLFFSSPIIGFIFFSTKAIRDQFLLL